MSERPGRSPSNMTLLALPAVPLARSPSSLALAGDRVAWSELVSRHDRRVLLSIVARGATIDTAREVAQQTWLRLFESAQRGELDALELPGLAIRQAEFLLHDRRRHEARARALEPVDDEAERLEPRLLARDALRVVEEVVARRPPGEQRIFWAVHEEPHAPHAELASRLGISVQHLRQTLVEVRHHLRRALEDRHD